MNILLASSRGGGLSDHMDDNVKSYVYPGGSFKKLNYEAKTKIPSPHLHHNKTLVYILAGIPDITTKLNRYKPTRYTECIYRGDTETSIDNIKRDIDTLEHTIINLGAVPIFCTITHMNISLYNASLKQKGKTTQLYYTKDYNTMQTKIEHIIEQVNYYIIGKNSNNHVSTPYCHSAIKTRKGRRSKHYYTNNWEGLNDGLHATTETRKKWANSISTSIKYIRTHRKRSIPSDTEDETNSPKRSWRRERETSGN